MGQEKLTVPERAPRVLLYANLVDESQTLPLEGTWEPASMFFLEKPVEASRSWAAAGTGDRDLGLVL
jgi:hypothetical protein